MSLQTKLIRSLLMFLWSRWPYLMLDIVIPAGRHIHANPRPKKRMVGETHTARMAGGGE